MAGLRALVLACGLTLCAALAMAGPALAATGSISGSVTDAIGEEPIGNVEVCAGGGFMGPSGGCAWTDGEGDYTISNLEPSIYIVTFAEEGSPNYLEQWYPEKTSRGEAGPVTVGDGQAVTGIDAKLQVGGQITGTVTDVATDLPIENVDVCAPSVAQTEITYCDRSDSEGNYRIHSLRTGAYTVEFFVERSPNYIRQYYPGKPSFSEAEPVSVSAGSITADVDAEMQQGVQITGRIYEAGSATPPQFIVACALDPVTEAQVGCDISEPSKEGSYSIAGLPLGSYVVGFSIDHEEDGMVLHPDEYVRQYYNGSPTFAAASLVGGPAGTYPGVDAHLIKGPEVFPERRPPSFAPGPFVPPPPVTGSRRPTPLRCHKGFVKKKVDGKPRCVKAKHKPKRRSRGAR